MMTNNSERLATPLCRCQREPCMSIVTFDAMVNLFLPFDTPEVQFCVQRQLGWQIICITIHPKSRSAEVLIVTNLQSSNHDGGSSLTACNTTVDEVSINV